MPLRQWAQVQKVLFAVVTNASSTIWDRPKSFKDGMIVSATSSVERLLLGADFSRMKSSYRYEAGL